MAQATLHSELPATPSLLAELIAEGLQPVRETLKRMEALLTELAPPGPIIKGENKSANVVAQHPPQQEPVRWHVNESRPDLNDKRPGDSSGCKGRREHAPSLRPWLQDGCSEPDALTDDHFPIHPLSEQQPHQSPPAAGGLEILPDADRPQKDAHALSVAVARKQSRELDLRYIARGSPSGESHISELTKSACWKLQNFFVRAAKQKEPERSGCLNALVTSPKFENLSAVVILVNSIFVAYTSDFEMKYPGESHHIIVESLEMFFISFYTAELLLRLVNHRLFFFRNADMKWNIFDFLLVSMSLFDLLMETFSPSDGSGGNVSFMRIFRLLKLAKILRTLRVMKIFRDLAQILESFKNCMTSLLWSLIMMLFVLYVFALIFIQGMTGVISETGEHDDVHDEIRATFGSMGSSMLSLYMDVSGGRDWADNYFLVSKAGPLYSALYITFMFFFAFALFNILTGVFVEKAVVSAQPEREQVILEQRRKTMEEASEFRHICKLLDTDETGTISRSEFYESMQNDLMVSYMHAVGLEIRDVDIFFEIALGSNAGNTEDPEEMKVGIDEFVDCCMSLRGMASSFDVQRQRFELQGLGRSFKDFEARSLHHMDQIISEVRHLRGLVDYVRHPHAGGSSMVSTPRVSSSV